ncbi:hypothetical protein [Luteolibacter sp. Populi]|uniref:hypothetical protein n=1 Tax=Luteolibacter sp. Populi TaxID=3230487 RepID=UPI0034668673
MKELLAALELDTIPQISLGTAAFLIFAACGILAVIRGFLRLLTGSLVLCASGFVAYVVWRRLPALGGESMPWLSIAVPVVAGLGVFLLLRSVLRFARAPFSRSDGGDAPRRSWGRRAWTLLFSLVPTSVLLTGGAAAVRNFGSVAEIRRFVDGSKAEDHSVFIAELKGALDKALPMDWMERIDPLADEARVTLAKLIALGGAGPPPKAVPVMEEPEIRQLVAHDPELRKLAKQGRYADILRDPRLDHVMADPDLKRMLGDLRL